MAHSIRVESSFTLGNKTIFHLLVSDNLNMYLAACTGFLFPISQDKLQGKLHHVTESAYKMKILKNFIIFRMKKQEKLGRLPLAVS